jgi:hypothetical protein
MNAEIYKIERHGKFDEASYPDFEKACWVSGNDQGAQVIAENISTHEKRRISRSACLEQLRKSPAPSFR